MADGLERDVYEIPRIQCEVQTSDKIRCKQCNDHTFLANCKACRNQKKYNADYNAAAHLRRAHFNPKKSHKAKGSDAGERREGNPGRFLDCPCLCGMSLYSRKSYGRIDFK